MSLRNGKTKAQAQQAIKNVNANLEKRFGGDSVLMKMSDTKNIKIETRSSGRPDLDTELGGGFAVGKIVEVYSEEACGKTGLVLEHVAYVQSIGGVVAYIDAEHALNIEYAERLGVNTDELILSQPETAEEVFYIMRKLVDSGAIDLIVVDSVAGMLPKAVLEGETGEAKIGALARIMSQGLSQIKHIASDLGCTLLFVNQLRDALNAYGSSKKPTGGNALKFYASQRIEIKKNGYIKEGEQVVGFKQIVHIVKNKCAPPFKKVEYDISFTLGVDTFGGLVEALVFEGILTKKGSWFVYDGSNIANGVKNLRQTFDENPELLEILETSLAEKRKGVA